MIINIVDPDQMTLSELSSQTISGLHRTRAYLNVEKNILSIFNVKDLITLLYLSLDVASGSEITSCNKIDKP